MYDVKKNKLRKAAKRLTMLCIAFFVLGCIIGYNAGKSAAQGKYETIVPIETEQMQQEQIFEPEPELVNIGNYMLTAYCPCVQCCGKNDGITSTGTKAQQGVTIAVDPKVIPYGTEVVIGKNTYIAQDCGSAIKGNRIDIYFDSHSDALKFGVQSADIYVKS